ncbi:MAG TPA: permease [Solirubrobacteraceae bacterium]|jgi:hypothetical protein
MSGVLEFLWHGTRDSLLMAWEVWWALVLGFAISAIVQAWVPRARIERSLSGSGPRAVAVATGLGAASSSCSYAAVAIAKSLFQKGASATTALAFQFSSTNLVWELGLVLWVLIGWQFTLAEYLGGILMVVLMAALLRVFVPRALERDAREHALAVDGAGGGGDHCHHTEMNHDAVGAAADGSCHAHAAGHDGAPGAAAEQPALRERLTSLAAWSQVARNFRADWSMVYREIAIGFLLAGFVAQLPDGFFEGLFIHSAPAPLPALENVLVGPLIAVLSFVCSVGNVPLAAVLWSGGIGFAGVISFLFADLIVLPIVAIYRKYYGRRFAARIVALMLLTMILASLAISGVFDLLGLIPTGPRPSRNDIFGSVSLDYKLVLNVIGAAIFVALFALGARGTRSALKQPQPAR